MTARYADLAGRLAHYGQAGVGPFAAAGAQFLLSVVLLHRLAPESFGAFSFLFVASQFSQGLGSALFCAPLPILLFDTDPERRATTMRALFAANLLFGALGFLVFVALGLALRLPASAAALFAAYAGLMQLRWFARAYAYAVSGPLRPMSSDLVYSAGLLVGVGWFHLSGATSLPQAYGVLAAAAAAGLASFGPSHLGLQLRIANLLGLAGYRQVWRDHSGWSLLGVITTEATANAHAYAVTLLSGAMAFAPIAASALMIRPVTVAANALMEFERPRMARLLAQQDLEGVNRAAKFFRLILALAWIATVGLSVLLLLLRPGLIVPAQYSRATVELGMVLWLVVAVARMLRSPDSVMLQAAGAFRPLASATVVSCGVSIAAVLLLLRTVDPTWSIAGILLGEFVSTAIVWRRSRQIVGRSVAAQA